MDIISFFRSIDGIPYYVMLVVNAILIFAIIGYLGDKKNEKYIKLGLQTNAPNASGGLNLNPITTDKHSNASIPTVAPTMANNLASNNESNAMMEQPIAINNNQFMPNTNIGTGTFVVSNPTPQNPNVGGIINNNGTMNNVNGNINQSTVQPVIRPEDNAVDPNEKAPTVLVINSDNTNMPK